VLSFANFAVFIEKVAGENTRNGKNTLTPQLLKTSTAPSTLTPTKPLFPTKKTPPHEGVTDGPNLTFSRTAAEENNLSEK
jgi:hypothetical protein